MTQEEIAQNKQFLLLPQCFPLLIIGYPFNYGDFPFFDKICSKSSAAEWSYEGKGKRAPSSQISVCHNVRDLDIDAHETFALHIPLSSAI